MRIGDKATMYQLLTAGELGNTIPQFGSVEAWKASGGDKAFPYWGVRTRTAGGPCRLNCPSEEVEETAERFRPHAINISVMISSVGQVTWLGDIWDSPTGITCNGVEYPPLIHDWRELMRTPSRWEGVAAYSLLRRHLNPNSLDDLFLLRDQFPGHIYELSAMDRCYGVVPHRNAIVWECRDY